MATTTTNYGFDVPTSSDLVKNGATQIALLGQDLDTFLFRPFTRNGVLNSSYNVWQRGTSIASGAAAPYTTDRWQVGRAGTVAGTTVSRQVTGDTTNLPNIQYCARVQRDSGNTSTAAIFFMQSFETFNAIPYAGKSIVLSFYARSGANYSAASSILSARIDTGTGTDQNVFSGYTGAATPVNQAVTLTTTWQRFSVTGTIASTATELGLLFTNTPVGTAGANDYFEITGVMLEVGSQASPYAPATPTYATELSACQRYYWRISGQSAAGNDLCTGWANSTVSAVGIVRYPMTMRVAPTFAVSAMADFGFTWSAGTSTISNLNPDRISVEAVNIRLTTTGLTTGQGGGMFVLTGTTKYLEASAEL
jgi:hypothetical protein